MDTRSVIVARLRPGMLGRQRRPLALLVVLASAVREGGLPFGVRYGRAVSMPLVGSTVPDFGSLMASGIDDPAHAHAGCPLVELRR